MVQIVKKTGEKTKFKLKFDKNGKVSNIEAENDPGYGTAEEAVRVMKLSPNWIPAKQNGKPVVYKHKHTITYVISED